MKLNILVVTKYKWATRAEKHREAKTILALGNFESINFTTQIRDVGDPVVNAKGRITQEWFEKAVSREAKSKGYNFILWQFSRADGKRWGLESRIHGLNFRDGDFYGEAWICCDERSIWKFENGQKRSEYPKTITHEIGHELTRQGFTKLEMHDYDYTRIRNNLEQFYMNIAKEQTTLLGSLLAKLSELKRELFLKQTEDVTDIRPLVKRQAAELIKAMAAIGLPIRITQGFRSIDEQNILYAKGRTTAGAIVTNAKGGDSFHNYGVAVDVVFTQLWYNATEAQWNKLGVLAESLGFEWGGRWNSFSDKPHLELTLGYTLKDFKEGKVDYNKYV